MTKTLNEVFQFAWKTHWTKERYVNSGHSREVKRNYENHIAPFFGLDPMNFITPKRVRNWHSQFEATPFAGNRSLEILSKLFTIAEEQEWLCPGTNPCRLVKAHTERKRKRYATKQELQKILHLLDKDKSIESAFLFTLLFTGARPRSLERATWSMVREMEKGHGAILEFHGKSSAESGEDETVVIPQQAWKKITAFPRWRSKFLFHGIKMPRTLWRKIRVEVKCEDLWARDFRRTFATIGFSTGISSDVVGELQNHRSAQTRMVYQKLMEDSKIKAAQTIANTIEELKNE